MDVLNLTSSINDARSYALFPTTASCVSITPYLFLNIIKFEEDSLESALDILLTEEQKQKRAIEYYSYIAELSAQNDDGTASIYKYEGSVHLSDGKSLHIKIDYGASAVEKLTKRKLEFVFLCD